MQSDQNPYGVRRRTASKAFLSLIVTWVLSAGPGGLGAGESLQVLSGGYPRAFFFRSSEMMAAGSDVSYGVWEKNFERLMGIEGKVLDKEIPGRSTRNLEFFRRSQGTAQQDLAANSGAAVSGPVTLGPKDALFLVKITP